MSEPGLRETHLHIDNPDTELAEQLQALHDLPEDTLGYAYIEFYRRNHLVLPGADTHTPAWGESQDWTSKSDHVAFHEKAIPWVYFGVEDHPEYHRPTDRFGTIPQDFFRRSAATVVTAVRSFDDDLDAIAKDSGR